MVNYKGPPKRFSMEESQELRTKAHAYSTDLQTGEVIIEEIPGYEQAGKKDIIVNDMKVAEIGDINDFTSNTNKEKSTSELLDEVKKYFPPKEKEPVSKTVAPKQKPVNEIRRLARLLEGY